MERAPETSRVVNVREAVVVDNGPSWGAVERDQVAGCSAPAAVPAPMTWQDSWIYPAPMAEVGLMFVQAKLVVESSGGPMVVVDCGLMAAGDCVPMVVADFALGTVDCVLGTVGRACALVIDLVIVPVLQIDRTSVRLFNLNCRPTRATASATGVIGATAFATTGATIVTISGMIFTTTSTARVGETTIPASITDFGIATTAMPMAGGPQPRLEA